MIFGIDKDRIVRASSHTGLAPDADRFVKIDDAVSPFEHCCGGAGGDARRVRALITAGYLVGAPRLREDTHVDVLDVSSRHPDGNDILRLARGRARVTSDATGVVDDLGPLHSLFAACLRFNHWVCGSGEYSTVSACKPQNQRSTWRKGSAFLRLINYNRKVIDGP